MSAYNKKKGIFFLLCSALSFSLMNVFARLAGDIPVMQKTFFRNLVSVLVIAVLLIRKHQKVRFQPGTLRYHFLRSFFGTLGVIGNFYAVDHMLLSDATMLVELSPFFVIIFSALLLREKVSVKQWLPVLAAFTGAAFVIKPTAGIFSNAAALSAIGTALAAGFAYTLVRKMSVMGEDGSMIVLFFSAFSCLVCLPSVILTYSPFTPQEFLFLLGAAVCGCCGQLSITAAYRHAPAAEISIFDYSQIIFSALFGWLIFGQLADKWSYLGYVIIIAAAVQVFLADRKKART